MKLSLAMIMVAILALVIAVMVTGEDDDPGTSSSGSAKGGSAASELLVREDSPVLSKGNEAVFVEFLDFECEACGALYPVIEDLRDRYGDQVTFVVRHMPLHGNSVNAARAAEAAAEQGEFEAMYKKLFETQSEWGHQESSQQEVFFGYAEGLGLDMARFRAAYNDPAIMARIEQGKKDARALDVTGTPTFFLDGERLEPTSIPDLEASFDAAVDN